MSMAKNNHTTHYNQEALERLFTQPFTTRTNTHDAQLEHYLAIAAMYAKIEAAIAVVSDAKERKSYLFYGALGDVLGIAPQDTTHILSSIWEEEILCRIPTEDLHRKIAEELLFLAHIKKHEDDIEHLFLESTLPMQRSDGTLIGIKHRIQYFKTAGAPRFALCLYNATHTLEQHSSIVNRLTGERIAIEKSARECPLTNREKLVLQLISQGLASKEIADRLAISTFTVSRHRQNIIFKMNVKNSSQACRIAQQLGLI